MNKLNLIAGLLLAASAATAQAAVIVDRANVPANATVLDFESFDGMVIGSGSLNYNGLLISGNQQFTAGQNIADLGENGVWGAGNHFLSFDHLGSMTLDISFNGQTTKGFAFDYSIYEEDLDGSAFLTARYFDLSNNLIKSTKFIYSPFGATTYDQFQSFGFVSNTANIARVSIVGDGVVLDNLTYTQPVPEPESYAMLLAGLGLMGLVARRRSKRG
ncbi:MAG: PEP-CTERM sorting domain-containing protein [Azonexus sp.]|nr:PEP-CTERM sorting domain-containing protein [Azonexus sp.]